MPIPTKLHGYRYSVYNRIARLVLEEKGVCYTIVEVDPFAEEIPASHLKMHPFGRVPVLCHGDFRIYETSAITRYIDAAFVGSSLTPNQPSALGRMAQVIAIVDNYGYWPMVRQVFTQRVFHSLEGEPIDENEILKGLLESNKVLAALEKIAVEGIVLDGENVSLADFHLAPLIDYFCRTPEGATAIKNYPSVARWWNNVSKRASFLATDPDLPSKHR